MQFETIQHTKCLGFSVHPDCSISVTPPPYNTMRHMSGNILVERTILYTSQGNPFSEYKIIVKSKGKPDLWLSAPSPFRKYFNTLSQMRNKKIDNIIDERL